MERVAHASGCRGGNGGTPYTGTDTSSGGGGGGVTKTAPVGQNNGGPGANGRIVMEDGDSVITGLGSASSVTPGEGDDGFYRGVFDAARFKGGGLTPAAVSDLFACCAFNPTYLEPVQGDFVAGSPVGTSVGTGMTALLIEAQGFNMLPDATPDAVGTGWYTVGHLLDSGLDTLPTWVPGQPTFTQLPGGPPPDNLGYGAGGIANLNGCEFIQLRVTIYLASSVGPFDAGPYLDLWTIRFEHDQ